MQRYASLRRGLVGCWCPSVSGPFGYRLPDLSGYGNHATLNNFALSGTTSNWVQSGGKGAIDFDGSNDYLDIPLPGIANAVSISYWAKHNTLPASNSYPNRQEAVFCGNAASSQVNYSVVHGSSQLHVTWTSATSTYQQQTATYTLAAIWTHICAILNWDADTASCYANGSKLSISLSNMNLNPTLTTGGRYFGRDGLNRELFNGQVDDIRIYNRALSEQEIRLLASERGIGLKPERQRNRYLVPALPTRNRSSRFLGFPS